MVKEGTELCPTQIEGGGGDTELLWYSFQLVRQGSIRAGQDNTELCAAPGRSFKGDLPPWARGCLKVIWYYHDSAPRELFVLDEVLLAVCACGEAGFNREPVIFYVNLFAFARSQNNYLYPIIPPPPWLILPVSCTLGPIYSGYTALHVFGMCGGKLKTPKEMGEGRANSTLTARQLRTEPRLMELWDSSFTSNLCKVAFLIFEWHSWDNNVIHLHLCIVVTCYIKAAAFLAVGCK